MKIKQRNELEYWLEKRYRKYKKHLKWKSVNYYNQEGKILESFFFSRTSYNKKLELMSITISLYDDKGNRMGVRGFDHKGFLGCEASCKYNDKNKKTEYFQRNIIGDSVRIWSDKYYYDKSGRVITVKGFKEETAKGKKKKKYYYIIRNKWGKDGRIKERLEYNKSRKKTIFEYNTKKRELTTRYYENGKISTHFSKNFYNDKGNCIRHNYYNKDYSNLIDTIIYKYDKYNNEIYRKRIAFYYEKSGVKKDPRELIITKYKYWDKK